MTTPNPRSSGKFIRVGKPVPIVDVDCSHWQRSASPRSRGRFVGVTDHVPTAEGGFVASSPAWLELLLSFTENTQPARAIEQTNRLILAASRLAPELGLVYDAARSRIENDSVVIALSPTRAGDVEKRLNDVAAALQHETTNLRQLVATVTRDRAA